MNPKILHYMINGLQVWSFVDDMCMNPPANINELRQRAAKFMRVEDMRKYKDNIKIDTTPVEKKEVDKALV